jgi:hypothetical protein
MFDVIIFIGTFACAFMGGWGIRGLYDPIDPLTNLPPAYILSMKKRRLQHGYE